MLEIQCLRPWRLAMAQIGPFRDQVETITFQDGEGQLCNLFMLAARNGRGKTTALNVISFLYSMPSSEFQTAPPVEGLGLEAESQLQLDLIAKVDDPSGSDSDILITLSYSHSRLDAPELFPMELGDVTVSQRTNNRATRRVRIGYRLGEQGKLEWSSFAHTPTILSEDYDEKSAAQDEHDSDALLQRLLIAWNTPAPLTPFSTFTTLARIEHRPTVLYFTAHRDVVPSPRAEMKLTEPTLPEYALVHRFGQEGAEWTKSLSNLLVWYYWMNTGLYEEVRAFINAFVFKNEGRCGLEEVPHKSPPGIDVRKGSEVHSIERLSSGERNLLQFAVRLGGHATRHTLILIDELENHLHPTYQRRMIQRLKDEVRKNPGWAVIFTTHSRDVVYETDFDSVEEGVVKGGEQLLARED